MCALLAGTAALCLQLSGGAHPEQNQIGRRVAVQGWVRSAAPAYGGDILRVVVQVEQMDGQTADFRLLCPELPVCEVGQTVTFQAELQPVARTEHRLQCQADGIFVQAEEVQAFAAGEIRRNAVRRLYALRQKGSRALRRALNREVGGVLAAVTVGDRTHLLPWLEKAYRRAGVPHVLVVSGLHLHILCGLVPLTMKSAVSRRSYGVLSLLLALFWIGLTGASPSVLRAGAAVGIHSLGVLLGFPADPVTSLALSGVLLSIGNPYAVCDVAFQLSFCAALGVLLGAALCRSRELPEKETLPRHVRRALREQLVVSGMAAILVLPIQMQWGMYISLMTVPANLAVFLLLRPLVFCGLLGLIGSLSPVLYFVRDGGLFAGGCLARLLNGIVRLLAAVPLPHFVAETGYPLLVWLVLVLFAGICYHRSWQKRWILAGCCGIVCAGVLLGIALEHNVVKVTLLGNRRSPAVVVTQQDRALVLYRGGTANQKKICRLLEARNITRPPQVVDLRLQPSGPCPLPAQSDLSLAESRFTVPSLLQPLPDVQLTMTMDRDGGVVALLCGGRVFWVNSGRLTTDLSAAPQDILLACAGDPGGLSRCPTILTLNSRYGWLPGTTEHLICGSGQLSLWLRPQHTKRIAPFRLIGATT